MSFNFKKLRVCADMCAEIANDISDYSLVTDLDTLENHYDFISEKLQNAYVDGIINFPTWDLWHDKNLNAYAKKRAELVWGGV